MGFPKKILFAGLLTIILIAIFELFSLVIIKIIIGNQARDYQKRMIISELYENVDFISYLKDSKAFSENILYDPYRGFKNPSNFKSKHINTDEYGRRYSGEKKINEKKDVVIGLFGGSTIFGVAAEDDTRTIPGELQKIIDGNCKKFTTKIINNGVGASNQTQSMIWLIESLGFQKYDYVIFYDFVNETTFAYSELLNTSSFDQELPPRFLTYQYTYFISPKFTKPNIYKITAYFKNTNSYQFSKIIYIKLRNIFLEKKDLAKLKKINIAQSREEEKIKKLINNYSVNMEIINSLGINFKFKTFFIQQPTLFTKKQLSENEKKIPHLNDLNYINFEKKVYKNANDFFSKRDNYFNFSDIFDNDNSTIYFDDHHMSSKGNKIVAVNIFEMLKKNDNFCN